MEDVKATEPSEMVKRLALIFAQHGDHFFDNDGPSNASWDDFSQREQLVATAAARAAIEAMMVPTQYMHTEGIRVMLQDMEPDNEGERYPPSVLTIYTAMVRASLSKGEE